MEKQAREVPRKRFLRRARIVFPGGFSAVDCIILDMTDRGARLKVGEYLSLPARFELRIENGPARKAEVRYRHLETAGVSFVDE